MIQPRPQYVQDATQYGAKYPKAVTTLAKDTDALLTFFDFRPGTGSISARPT